MRILVAEDEHKIAHSIKRGLEQETYAVDVAYDGEEAYEMASIEEYDVILMDIMMPKMDGIEVVTKLRSENIHIPILMLTAKSQTEDKVEGLNSGADDYLAKPFAFEELLARIRALTRRPKTALGDKLVADNLVVDTQNLEVKRKDKKIELTKKEYALLEYLLRNSGKTISKDQIISHVWNYQADILPNTVEVYIGYLRTKIDKAFPKEKQLIKTARGFGYKIET